MFVALWEFDVKPGSAKSFESVYGPRGEWARLFRRQRGFQWTILLRVANRAYRYWTCDVWNSRKDYENFLRRRGRAYAELDKKCAKLTLKEREIGRFQEL